MQHTSWFYAFKKTMWHKCIHLNFIQELYSNGLSCKNFADGRMFLHWILMCPTKIHKRFVIDHYGQSQQTYHFVFCGGSVVYMWLLGWFVVHVSKCAKRVNIIVHVKKVEDNVIHNVYYNKKKYRIYFLKVDTCEEFSFAR